MEKNIHISIVSPVYKAEKIVSQLVSRIISSVDKITSDFEIILVEDGSPDNSWEEIEKVCLSDKRVKGIKLSRNFGQHEAITAGLEITTGDWIVVMDCDLQDKPENIPIFHQKAIEGYDMVVGKKSERKDHILRKIESAFFYKILEKLTGVKVSLGIGNFGIYNRTSINSFLSLKEEYRSFGMIMGWLGFNRYELEIESDERHEGKSSYTFWKKWKLALTTITSFSNRILILIITIGFCISFSALCFLVLHIFNVWKNSQPIAGWSSLILSIFLSLGIVVSCIGVVGLYVGKIFSQVKNRPLYIVAKKKNYE